MADKQTQLSIVLSAVDKASGPIKALNARLDTMTKPIRDFKSALGDLRGKSGLDDVIGGFKGVGSAIGDLLGKVAMIGGVVGLAGAGLFHLVGEFEDLGKKAERLGVGVDFLAAMRDAAERTGVPIDALDAGLQQFSVNVGKAQTGIGRMVSQLAKVHTTKNANFGEELLGQLKGAKDGASAIDVLAKAMARLKDPADRAALATMTLGDATLAPFLAKGPKAIKEMRDHYLKFSGSQEVAAKAAAAVHDKMLDVKSALDGVKAKFVAAFSPVLGKILENLADWLATNRDRIGEVATMFAARLPGAIDTVISAVRGIIETLAPFFDSATKIKIVLGAIAAVMAGPLISAIATLGIAMATTPIGQLLAALGLLAAAAGLIIKNWDDISEFFEMLWDDITGVFEAAWQKISAIVEKIKGAVTWVKDKLDFVLASSLAEQGLDALDRQEKADGPGGSGNVVDKALSSLRVQQLAAPQTMGTIKVDFANMPKGARVSTAPGSTADIDLTVGWATGWMPGS